MIAALYIVGVVVIISSVIVGFSSGSFLGFIIAVAGGIGSAIIFFALARILENQGNIIYKLDRQEEIERKSRTQEKRICPKCNYIYDGDYTSCPHCGHRE